MLWRWGRKLVRRDLLAILAAAWLTFGSASTVHAGSLRFCDRPVPLNASQQDTLLRFSDVIKAELDSSGQSTAIVSRSGLDLSRFGMRYSHAGISLKGSQNTPWSIRQLYYACDEKKPKIFDQGMAGFVIGTEDASIGYISVVLLPEEPEKQLAAAALDNAQSLRLLSQIYTANAYPYAQQFQNCNQWVVEMLAAAFAGPTHAAKESRAAAQQWLQENAYLPAVIDVGSRLLMWVASWVALLSNEDHPWADISAKIYKVSMPSSIEAFLQQRFPSSLRIEFCHTDKHIVIHRGWEPVAEGCIPKEGDQVIAIDQ
jgi:hypothetical protein